MDAAEKARELLKSYLNKRLQVELSDGRIVEGIFMCTDRDRNIVLSSCEEFYDRQEIEAAVGACHSRLDVRRRTLGMAIVPGEHIRSISMATNTNTMVTETSSTATETNTNSLIAAEPHSSPTHDQTSN